MAGCYLTSFCNAALTKAVLWQEAVDGERVVNVPVCVCRWWYSTVNCWRESKLWSLWCSAPSFSSCFEGGGNHRGPQRINTQLFRVSAAYVTPAPKPLFSSLTTCTRVVFFFFFLSLASSVGFLVSFFCCLQWTSAVPHSVSVATQSLNNMSGTEDMLWHIQALPNNSEV